MYGRQVPRAVYSAMTPLLYFVRKLSITFSTTLYGWTYVNSKTVSLNLETWDTLPFYL